MLFLNLQYTYFLILAASLAGPLCLSFDRKVAFYRKWKYLFPAMLIPAVVYILWDVYFTANGVWAFNEKYITGITFINLPLEEMLFFFVVPYCCVFIYECIRSYFPLLKEKKSASGILKIMAIVLAITGILFYDRHYTCWTFLLTAFFIAMMHVFKEYFQGFDAASFLVVWAICLIPFLVVNGFLTAIPVVLYNDTENLGVRIYTIPLEDIFYGMLLLMMNIAIYEKLRRRHTA